MLLLHPSVPGRTELWLRYTIEFARRGLMLCQLELNGPGLRPNDRVWGTARVLTRSKEELRLRFLGRRGCVSRHDVRGLRLLRLDGWRLVSFPALPRVALPDELRQLIRSCRIQLRRGRQSTPPSYSSIAP